MIGNTIVDLFNYVLDVNKRPNLLNYRFNNSWKSISTDEFGNTVKKIAAGLYKMGVREGRILAFYPTRRLFG